MKLRTALGSPVSRSLAVVLAAGLLATACSSGSNSTSSSAGGGTLVIGYTADPNTLDPWKATQFQAEHLLEQVYGTLTQLDANMNVQPGLAQSWTYSNDNKTLTLHLRQGVKFQDGQDFTSADVKSSLDRLRDPATAAVAASYIASVSSVDTPDANTAVLNLSAPDAGLLASLANVNLAILSKDNTEQQVAAKPNGTGPFSYTSRTPNQSVTLTANPNYWAGKPKSSQLQFRIIPDESSVVSAMQSGNVQFAVLDDPTVAKTAQGSGLTLDKTPDLGYHVLQLNSRKAPLNNVNVRLAMQCAISRQQVVDTAALGQGTVIGPITSPAYKSDPNAQPCATQNVAKAKQLLTQAGYPNGLTITAIVSTGLYSTSVNEAQNLQSQLKAAGITLKLQTLDSAAYVDAWVAGNFTAAVALNGGSPDPDGMYGRYFTSTGNLNKVAGFSSPQLDQLFAQGKATTDPAQRKQIYTQISNYLTDNAVWIWLFSSYDYTATTSTVHGFTPMPNGSFDYLWQTSSS
ncbi:ABC transporter substrate-binding protein [Rugosimonospora acidiphila]|uniref:ABC transporter substrate-binding protein n=1 Tax=Rugosimonospora acidiphila TaxID=556531 RepID=A0ABP9RMD6_9ACTN